MSWSRDLALAAGGVLLGLPLGLVLASSSSSPTPPAPPRSAPQATPARSERTAIVERNTLQPKAETASCDNAIAKALANDRVRRRLAATGQFPADWPPDLPDLYTQHTVEQQLHGIVARFPSFGELSLDCSEFPCLAFIEIRELELGDDTSEAMDQVRLLNDALEQVWPDLHNRRSVSCDNKSGCSTSFNFAPKAHLEELKVRLDTRRKERDAIWSE